MQKNRLQISQKASLSLKSSESNKSDGPQKNSRAEPAAVETTRELIFTRQNRGRGFESRKMIRMFECSFFERPMAKWLFRLDGQMLRNELVFSGFEVEQLQEFGGQLRTGISLMNRVKIVVSLNLKNL